MVWLAAVLCYKEADRSAHNIHTLLASDGIEVVATLNATHPFAVDQANYYSGWLAGWLGGGGGSDNGGW